MLRASRRAWNCLAVVMLGVIAAALSAGCAADAPDVALRVNGHPVTRGEIADAKAQFTAGMDAMREQIDAADPSVKPWLEELARGQAKYSVDATVIGGIVIEYAEYDAAIKAGFSASDDEVAEVVSVMRGQHEQVLEMIEEYGIDEFGDSIDVAGIGELGSVAEYIEAMGEDRYWDESFAGADTAQLGGGQVEGCGLFGAGGGARRLRRRRGQARGVGADPARRGAVGARGCGCGGGGWGAV